MMLKRICASIFLLALLCVLIAALKLKDEKIIEVDSDAPDAVSDIMQWQSSFADADQPACQQRTLAVILANDPVTRPLAGLTQADLVFEIPVVTGSITRILAVYGCEIPDAIGSLRSARHDFIPLAQGIDAILVHWGGSHYALDRLDARVMDNIDAMINLYKTFYRKSGIPWPHNGFTSKDRLLNAVEQFGYRSETEFTGYIFTQADISQTDQSHTLRIGYAEPYDVRYGYDPDVNLYYRWRNGTPEMDANNSQQVAAKNIVVMRVVSEQIEGPDYNDLHLEGESGRCIVYQNGIVLPCTWEKGGEDTDRLRFINSDTKREVTFVPGQTWIEMVEPYQKVTWD